MRHRKVLAAVGVTGLAAAAIPTIALTQSDGRPDLVIAGAAEAPDFERAGGSFRSYFTVANEGRQRAQGGSVTRIFLSTDQSRGRGDVRLASRRMPALRTGGQDTQRVLLTIPASTPTGYYHLVYCADATTRVRESDEGDNCRASGQRLGVAIVPDARGIPGPQGPPGPRGEPGDPGPEYGLRTIPRVTLSFGVPDIDDVEGGADGDGDDEGSDSKTDLVTVGPIRFVGLCRREPDNYENDPTTNVVEAKIVVETTSGTMSFRSANGPRANIPATGTPGAEGSDGGEGKRQIVGVQDPPPQAGGNFQTATGFVAHSDGTHVAIVGLHAGVRTPHAPDGCVFSGAVRQVSP